MPESQNSNPSTTGWECSPLFLDSRNPSLDEDLKWMVLCVATAEHAKNLIMFWHQEGEIDFEQRVVMMKHVHIRENEENGDD